MFLLAFRYLALGSHCGGLVTKSCLTLATPWTVARQAHLSMGFSRQEYWSGLPFPSPEKAHKSNSQCGFKASEIFEGK